MIQINRNNKSKQEVLINILTRTSNRPIGFNNCYQSIVRQTYKNVKHFVTYENDLDLNYINFSDVIKIKVNKGNRNELKNLDGFLHAPYNLYCNEMLNNVDSGWVLFLDDDDHLLHNNVLKEIVSEIKKTDEDTMFIWQIRYPNGNVLPKNTHFKSKKIEINNIGTTCFIFHSKYKKSARWDEWKGSDFRFICNLLEKIPKKKWIKKVFIQINNLGDFGNRNDINQDTINKLIFKKKWFWFLIPKYHFRLFDIYIFKPKTYKILFYRVLNFFFK